LTFYQFCTALLYSAQNKRNMSELLAAAASIQELQSARHELEERFALNNVSAHAEQALVVEHAID
jgi:hypothetical protein